MSQFLGIDYEPGDGDFFEDDLEDDEAYDYDNHIRPSDLQKQLEAQAIKDLEAQKRVSKELEALSAINAGNTRTAEDAAAEKLLRDIQLRASQDDRRRRESLKLEEDKRLTEVAAAEKSRKFEQLQEDLEKQRRKMEKEEDEEEEKRKLAAAINTERIQRDAELLFEKAQQENRALVDEISAEKTRKANAQRLKREVFLNDVNAFSETIEQQAARSSGVRQLSANGAVCEQYKIQSVRFADEPPSFSHQPPSPHADTPRIRSSSDADAPHSFNELTSSLFAANSASTAAHIERNGDRGNRSDIWGDRRDYPNINSAANVTAQRAESYRREQEHQSENEQEQSERHDGGGDEVSQTDEEEEEEGMGGASSISNILTIDERRELSVEQKVAWRALQADLTTRRKGAL